MVSLGAAFDEVLQIVRTEAAALGMDQTPVLLGLVEGGLTIPVLRKGTRFLEAFPESRAYQVSRAMSDLLFCGVPDSVVNQWSARYSEGLNSLQQTAINEFGVLRGESVFVVAPTVSRTLGHSGYRPPQLDHSLRKSRYTRPQRPCLKTSEACRSRGASSRSSDACSDSDRGPTPTAVPLPSSAK